MLHHTKGIVLRTVKYGETSVIVAVYTEQFGMQSYLVNAVRTSTKKGSGKANLLQPGAFLDLVVYHNELKQLQRIKEFKWSFIYQNIFSDIKKNSVALFMIELLQKVMKQPEHNEELFHFIEDAFIHLDKSNEKVAANFALYFALHLATLLGIKLNDNYSEERNVLDLQEGNFEKENSAHPYYINQPYSFYISQFLKVMQPGELEQIQLNREIRRTLMHAIEIFFSLHISDFGKMKSLPVLQELLS
ncbi:MAG: DNA repair protein RecO [Bacteroidota bacterium]